MPEYDLDSEDEEWLNAQTKERVSPCNHCPITQHYPPLFIHTQPLSPLHFEKMMDKLERGSGNTVKTNYYRVPSFSPAGVSEGNSLLLLCRC